jgi:tetratricopeptide (TPR) repeat protein
MKFRVRVHCGPLSLICVLVALSMEASPLTSTNEAQQWEQLMTDTTRSLRVSNNVSGAMQLCEEALNIAGNFGPNDLRLSKSQVLRAEVYLWERKNDLAEQTFKLAISSCEKAAGSNDIALIDPLSSLANFYLSGVPRYDEVVPLYRRVLDIVQNAPVKNSRDIIMWSRNLGMIYQQMGRYAEAEPLYRQTVLLAEQNDAAWLPYELLTTADFYRAWGKCAEAETHAKRALAIREKAVKADGNVDAQMDVAVCLNNLGAIYLAWSKPDQAESVFRRSLETVKPFMAEDQVDWIPPLKGLAEALRAQGKLDQAEPVYQRIFVLTEKNARPESPDTAAWLEKYAALLSDLKKPAEAKDLLERAGRIRQHCVANPEGARPEKASLTN